MKTLQTLLTLLAFFLCVIDGFDMGGMGDMEGMGDMDPMAAMANMPGEQKRKKPYTKWHKRIQCQVCEESIKQVVRSAKNLKQQLGDRLAEEDIMELMDRTCNPFDDEGIWITLYDIVAKPPKVVLEKADIPKDVDYTVIGHCGKECETIAYSCDKIFHEYEIELSESLYKKPSRSSLRNLICTKLCKEEKHDVKKTSKLGRKERWREADYEQRQMLKMADLMPQNVKMFDPGAIDYDDMDSMGGYGGLGGLGGMGGMDGMPDMDSPEFQEMYQKYLEEMGENGELPPDMMDEYDPDGMSYPEDTPSDYVPKKKSKKKTSDKSNSKPAEPTKSDEPFNPNTFISDTIDGAKNLFSGLFGSGDEASEKTEV